MTNTTLCRWAVAVSIAFLGICFFACSGTVTDSGNASQGTQEEDVAGGERYAAQQAAKKIIAPLLLSPTTAQWPWDSISSMQLHDGREYRAWIVQGAVDAKNVNGVPIRHSWEVVEVLNRADDKLFPIRVKFNEQIVWGSTKAVNELLDTDRPHGQTTAAEEQTPTFSDDTEEQTPTFPDDPVETPSSSPAISEEARRFFDNGDVSAVEPPSIEPDKQDDEVVQESPAPEYRTWSTSDGRYQVQAVFKGAALGKVKLQRKDNGKVVELSLDKLSEGDKAWIKQRRYR